MSKARPTRSQENVRRQGLRILARIIARYYLPKPDLYPGDAAGNGGADPGDKDNDEKEDAT